MKNTRPTKNILATSAVALLALCALPATTHAALKLWTDLAGDGLWATGNNWNGAAVPAAAGDDLDFSALLPLAGVRTATNGPVTTANSLTFTGPTQQFILNGTALTVGLGGIANNSGVGGNGQTISFGGTGVTVGINETWAANTGKLLVTRPISPKTADPAAAPSAARHDAIWLVKLGDQFSIAPSTSEARQITLTHNACGARR